MMTTAEYRKLSALVKGWADKVDILAANLHREGHGRSLETAAARELAEEMHAFSNGIAHVVSIFAPIIDATTPEETEAAAIALTNKVKPVTLTLALRDPLPMPAVTPFAMQTISVAPGTDVAMHFMLPRDYGDQLVITARVRTDDPAPTTTAGGMEIRQCRRRTVHSAHYWRDLRNFACNGIGGE